MSGFMLTNLETPLLFSVLLCAKSLFKLFRQGRKQKGLLTYEDYGVKSKRPRGRTVQMTLHNIACYFVLHLHCCSHLFSTLFRCSSPHFRCWQISWFSSHLCLSCIQQVHIVRLLRLYAEWMPVSVLFFFFLIAVKERSWGGWEEPDWSNLCQKCHHFSSLSLLRQLRPQRHYCNRCNYSTSFFSFWTSGSLVVTVTLPGSQLKIQGGLRSSLAQ